MRRESQGEGRHILISGHDGGPVRPAVVDQRRRTWSRAR